MGQLVAHPSLTDRMIRAARLDVSLYNEVEADVSANNQALTVVALSAVASGIGAALGAAIQGRPGLIVGGLIGAIVLELAGLGGLVVRHVFRRHQAVPRHCHVW